MSKISAKIKSIKKGKLFLFLLTTLLLFGLITGIYFILFVKPLNDSKRSLDNAKKLATEMKLLNSQDILASTDLEGINPSHPSYDELIDNAVSAAEDSEKRFGKVNNDFLKSRYGGTKVIKTYLKGSFKDGFSAILSDYAKANKVKADTIAKYKKIYPPLSKVIKYNPYVDIGNLKLDEEGDREKLANRALGAVEGLAKAKTDLISAGLEDKEMEPEIESLVAKLNDLTDAITASDFAGAEKARTDFLDSYDNVYQKATLVLRMPFASSEIKETLEIQKNINSDLDLLILAIEEKQKTLPSDPLSKY